MVLSDVQKIEILEIKRNISDTKLNYFTKQSKFIIWFRIKKKKNTKSKPNTEFSGDQDWNIKKRRISYKVQFFVNF